MNKYEIELAGRTLSIETGSLAQQANGSVVVRYGDTVVLVTAVAGPAKDGIDFMPLTVDFEERLYAVGRIPGSFFAEREDQPPRQFWQLVSQTEQYALGSQKVFVTSYR